MCVRLCGRAVVSVALQQISAKPTILITSSKGVRVRLKAKQAGRRRGNVWPSVEQASDVEMHTLMRGRGVVFLYVGNSSQSTSQDGTACTASTHSISQHPTHGCVVTDDIYLCHTEARGCVNAEGANIGRIQRTCLDTEGRATHTNHHRNLELGR